MNPTPKLAEQVGAGFPKLCGAMDGGTQASQGLGRALMKQSFMRQPSDRNL